MRQFAVLHLVGQAGIVAALSVEVVVHMCPFRMDKAIPVGEDIDQLVQDRRLVLSAVSPASEADTADIAVAEAAAAGMHSVEVTVGYTVETDVAEMGLDIGTFAVALVVAAYISVDMVESLALPFASAVPFSVSPSLPSFHG